MNPQEQAQYRASIQEEIVDWEPEACQRKDPWWPAIERIPLYFDALIALAARPELSDTQRRVVNRVIKYLVSPLDLMPEFIYGLAGFREDLALIADAAEDLSRTLGRYVIEECGFAADDPGLAIVREREEELPEDVRYHLRLLLTADSVAGDESLSGGLGLAGNDIELPPRNEPHRMVFAGPGTGKTYRLETELCRLLIERQVPPEQVLVTTFTNKAADELRVRVSSRLEAEAKEMDVERVMQRLSISTIHSFCFRLIGEFHHHALFLKGAYGPMDETQRMLFLFRNGIHPLKLKNIYPDWKQEQRQLSGWHPIDFFHFYAYVGQLYDFLSEDVMKGEGDAAPLRRRYLQITQDGAEGGSVDERIIRTYPRYWRLVQEEGFLDNSMILAYAEALLDDPQVRRHVQARFRHVLVDEYQDTNPIQDRIFRAVTGHSGRLFAVGDDDQSIYAFRGADVRNATDFLARWPGAQWERLEQNRRSTGKLVSAAQALIRHNRVRQEKELYTSNAEGIPPWRLEADAKELPVAVAELLAKLKTEDVIHSWRDVGLLFRAMNSRVPEYRAALDARGIPNVLAGDRRFLKRPMVKGLMKTLEMIQGDNDKITNRMRAHKPFFQALGIDDRDTMLEHIRTWHQRAHDGEYDSMLALFYAIINDTGAVKNEDLLSDLGHLSSFIAAAEAQLTSPELLKRLGYFLKYAEAAADSFAGPAVVEQDQVQIMTIHKSKGLEFPLVIVADLIEGSLPANFGQNLRDRLRKDLAGIPSHLDTVEEERRVLYVAMTRAEDYVVLATTPDAPSSFLAEFSSLAVDEAPAHTTPPRRYYVQTEPKTPPLHVSHSAVFNYYFCPRRYLLSDRCGFASQVIAPVRAGQSLHRALEIYHRLKRDGEHITPKRREMIFERAWVRPHDKGKAKKEFERLFSVFDCYADRAEREFDGGRVRVVDAELPFYIAEGGGVLTGKIDLVRERDNELEIVEFKFNENNMMPGYPNRQLEHYSLAYPHQQPRLTVHYLKEDKIGNIAWREPKEIRKELSDTFERIRGGEFPAQSLKKNCKICPVRFACAQRTG